jgi:hypothetical protein
MARAKSGGGLLSALNTPRPAMRRAQPTVDQLVAVIRQYQHANGPDRLAEADAAAVALIGPAPLESVVEPKRRRAKVERS